MDLLYFPFDSLEINYVVFFVSRECASPTKKSFFVDFFSGRISTSKYVVVASKFAYFGNIFENLQVQKQNAVTYSSYRLVICSFLTANAKFYTNRAPRQSQVHKILWFIHKLSRIVYCVLYAVASFLFVQIHILSVYTALCAHTTEPIFLLWITHKLNRNQPVLAQCVDDCYCAFGFCFFSFVRSILCLSFDAHLFFSLGIFPFCIFPFQDIIYLFQFYVHFSIVKLVWCLISRNNCNHFFGVSSRKSWTIQPWIKVIINEQHHTNGSSSFFALL